MAKLLNLESEAADRLNQLMPLINVPPGTLDRLDGETGLEGSSRQAWSEVIIKMGELYGRALLTYQRRLVARRSEKGLSDLQTALNHDFGSFRHNVEQHTSDDELPTSLVDPFALTYMAFKAAERLKVLPKSADRQLATWRVFKRFVEERPRPVSAASILTDIASLPDVLNVEDIDDTMGKAELQAAPAFIKTRHHGRRELWVETARKKEVFDWPMFSKFPDFDQWFCGKGEKDRAGGKRVIGGWKNARVLRFWLP